MFAFLTGHLFSPGMVRDVLRPSPSVITDSGCRLPRTLPHFTVPQVPQLPLPVPRKGRDSAGALRSSLLQAGSLQTVQEVTKGDSKEGTPVKGREGAKGQPAEVSEQGKLVGRLLAWQAALRKADHIRSQEFPGPEHPRPQEKPHET